MFKMTSCNLITSITFMVHWLTQGILSGKFQEYCKSHYMHSLVH